MSRAQIVQAQSGVPVRIASTSFVPGIANVLFGWVFLVGRSTALSHIADDAQRKYYRACDSQIKPSRFCACVKKCLPSSKGAYVPHHPWLHELNVFDDNHSLVWTHGGYHWCWHRRMKMLHVFCSEVSLASFAPIFGQQSRHAVLNEVFASVPLHRSDPHSQFSPTVQSFAILPKSRNTSRGCPTRLSSANRPLTPNQKTPHLNSRRKQKSK